MPVLPWYGYPREPQVMVLLPRGSRALQPIVLNGLLIFSGLIFLQIHELPHSHVIRGIFPRVSYIFSNNLGVFAERFLIIFLINLMSYFNII